ncbi:hypothetical protein EYF80_010206 [Liparis tanakae]|uniref:Uncharacterized protein n=1 Tax=Liparis tanakae TaxID=230148 RepID=A0A4Z2IQ40_9TELE|nr:hypothetical protein EYF80_010206 [Liparis tanakae]
MCVSILSCSSSIEADSVSYRAWTQCVGRGVSPQTADQQQQQQITPVAEHTHLGFGRLLAAHVPQALDVGLQLLRLSGDLLDPVGHLFAPLLSLPSRRPAAHRLSDLAEDGAEEDVVPTSSARCLVLFMLLSRSCSRLNICWISASVSERTAASSSASACCSGGMVLNVDQKEREES